MAWVLENKEWLFSGVLVALPLAILGWIFGRRAVTRMQSQRGGRSSTNIQAGGDAHVQMVAPDDKAKSKSR